MAQAVLPRCLEHRFPHCSSGWVWLGAGETQGGPLGFKTPGDEIEQTEEEVTSWVVVMGPRYGEAALISALLGASHLSEPRGLGSGSDDAVVT